MQLRNMHISPLPSDLISAPVMKVVMSSRLPLKVWYKAINKCFGKCKIHHSSTVCIIWRFWQRWKSHRLMNSVKLWQICSLTCIIFHPSSLEERTLFAVCSPAPRKITPSSLVCVCMYICVFIYLFSPDLPEYLNVFWIGQKLSSSWQHFIFKI